MGYSYRQAIWGLTNGCLALTILAGIWWAVALTTPSYLERMPWSGIGVALGEAVLLVATLGLRRQARGVTRSELVASNPVDAQRLARGYRLIVATEFVSIGAVWVGAIALGQRTLALPLTALIVSLHFAPVAKLYNIRTYYVTAVVGTVFSLLALLNVLERPITILSTGMGATLWLTVVYQLATADSFAKTSEALSQQAI